MRDAEKWKDIRVFVAHPAENQKFTKLRRMNTNTMGEMKMTQHDRILDYIDRFGSITTMEAFNDLGITKLTTRISEMRNNGIQFTQTWETRKNRFGEKVRYMRYSRVKNNA